MNLKGAIEEGLTKSRKFVVLQDNSSAEIRVDIEILRLTVGWKTL